ANADGSARAGRVQIVGADKRFWQLGPEGSAPVGWAGEVVLNRPLADRLGAGAGDMLLLRVEKPSPLPRDAPLSIEEGSTVAFRIRVGGVASEGEFGRFSLRANQVAPLTVFVPLSILQDKVGLGGKVNTLLVGRGKAGGTAEAQEALRRNWQLADADLELRTLGEQGALELRSGRVFIDTAIAEAAPRGLRILTYFVNELRAGGRSTPYSIVTAIDPAGEGRPASAVPPDMKDDEILLNAWVADDLEAGPGDTVELTYFVVGPMRRLHEEEARFRVRAILPMEGAAADRELMPALPGLAGVENCRDWKAGIPIRFEKIRDKDEEYWDRYGGTPKAFVTLRAGRRMWGNRFGNLTALRYPLDGAGGEELWASMRRKLDPAAIGLYFRAVRDEALAASREGTDFGHLFLGMSFFLIVAAALLTGLLFVFSVEHRAQEVGTLLALGFRPSRVRRVLLAEGAVLAIAGGLLGTFAGVFYTKAVLYGLATVWSEAVSEATLRYHAEASTLAAGFAAGVCVALLSMWFTLRKQARLAARELLASASGAGIAGRRRVGLWLALAAIVPALVILLLAGTGRGWSAAGAFFASGALLLAGAIGLSHWLMSTLGMSKRMTLAGMGLRNASRRLGRSLLTVALLACGCFLIVAVSANRLGTGDEIERRDSGTGGFALFGEPPHPVFSDPNSGAGRDAYGLESSVMEDV
ncbi:MAG: FtsX-like permease family protein, partial [Planctomycetia bacterium]|nr:FtsX-like permease family protein [Planctomycetia bacterium]